MINIFIASIILAIWAVVLFIEKSKKNITARSTDGENPKRSR